MRLRVVTPASVRLEREVARIVAEGPDGHFGLLPRHVDFVSELVPGILTFTPPDGPERFIAIHAGTLVKCGDAVTAAVRDAIEGDDLGRLRARVEAEFRRQDEAERDARSALARLEASLIRRFRDLEITGS